MCVFKAKFVLLTHINTEHNPGVRSMVRKMNQEKKLHFLISHLVTCLFSVCQKNPIILHLISTVFKSISLIC